MRKKFTKSLIQKNFMIIVENFPNNLIQLDLISILNLLILNFIFEPNYDN
jgi:hypothetical protein